MLESHAFLAKKRGHNISLAYDLNFQVVNMPNGGSIYQWHSRQEQNSHGTFPSFGKSIQFNARVRHEDQLGQMWIRGESEQIPWIYGIQKGIKVNLA